MQKQDKTRETSRRDFITTLATGATALSLTSIPSPLKAASTIVETKTDADIWFEKVKGKHRMVFDATNHHESMPLAWARVFMTTNNSTGTPDSDLGVVVVLRHDAIPLAMVDALWSKYKFGEVFKIQDNLTGKPAERNIYWNPNPGELHFPDMSIDQLQKRGAMFCVCEMAITIYAMVLGQKIGLDKDEVKKEWIAGLHPSIQLVPSGIWAVGRAQEHGCAYVFAG